MPEPTQMSAAEACAKTQPQDHVGHYELGWEMARKYYESRAETAEAERDTALERVAELEGALREIAEWPLCLKLGGPALGMSILATDVLNPSTKEAEQ